MPTRDPNTLVTTHTPEIKTIYDDGGRYLVSLVVSYGPADGVHSPQEALDAALGLVTDGGSEGTMWCVCDRSTGSTHLSTLTRHLVFCIL
jgi:hypothetical protein